MAVRRAAGADSGGGASPEHRPFRRGVQGWGGDRPNGRAGYAPAHPVRHDLPGEAGNGQQAPEFI